MTKTKDEGEYSTYMVKISCMLINQCRFLVAMVPRDFNQIGTHARLDNLEWKHFQTRLLENIYEVKSHSFTPINTVPYNVELKATDMKDEYTTYKPTFYNVSVTLLHPEKQKYYYPNTGNLNSALETYNCIVSVL